MTNSPYHFVDGGMRYLMEVIHIIHLAFQMFFFQLKMDHNLYMFVLRFSLGIFWPQRLMAGPFRCCDC